MAKLSANAIAELAQLAETAAIKAGQFIATVDKKTLQVERKNSGSTLASQVVTEVDRQAEAIIQHCLKPSLKDYDLAFLAEESANQAKVNQHERFAKTAFWCVDPLDGTLAFTEGRDGYAVAIALVNQAGQTLLGVVYDPITGQCWNSLTLNNAELEQVNVANSERSLNFFCDVSFLTDNRFKQIEQKLQHLQAKLNLTELKIQSNFGAVKNAIAVMQTPNSLYFKLPKKQTGGGALWDFSATTALFNATGKPCGNANGKAINFNQRDSLYLNNSGVLFCSDDAIKSEWLALMASGQCAK